MADNELEVLKSNELARETAAFEQYLEFYGLPKDNVIASTDERRVIGENLPNFLNALGAEEKQESRYLSKFIGAASIGLFDAALNYVWNEVVINLRKKASMYGSEIFFDAAVGGKNRESYKDENDLAGLKDIVLLDTCRKLELISEIVYQKLNHILTMRNEVAASHPNVEHIGGYELLGWLQTCVKDVLQDRPSESAIQITSLVVNLKSKKDLIDQVTVDRFASQLRNLSSVHVHNLLVTFFGIFVSPETDQILRKNISMIAPHIWNHSADNPKFKLGARIDGYRTNLQEDKLQRSKEFLYLVNGLRYETLPTRTVTLDGLANKLEETHTGMDNFYHEPPVMKEIAPYVQSSNDLPNEVMPKLVGVILRCRIGRGVSYNDGVSPSAKPLYDNFFSLLDDDGIAAVIKAIFSPEINVKLQNKICQEHLASVLDILEKTVISERLREAINSLQKDVSTAWRANKAKEFKELMTPFATI